MSGENSQRFNVHIYAIAKVKVCGITGNDHKQVTENALNAVDLDSALNLEGRGFEVANGEEVSGFLLDPLLPDGKVDYDHAVTLDHNAEPAPMGTAGAEIDRLKARVAELESFVRDCATVALDGEKVLEDGTVVEDDDAVLENDGAVSALGDCVLAARELIKPQLPALVSKAA